MWDNFDKTPSFVDSETAQKVRVARGKEKQPNSQTCYPHRIHIYMHFVSNALPHFPRSSKRFSIKSSALCSAPLPLSPSRTAAAPARIRCSPLRNCCSRPRGAGMISRRCCLRVALTTISVYSCCASATRCLPWLLVLFLRSKMEKATPALSAWPLPA
jgi:hypothetical protein